MFLLTAFGSINSTDGSPLSDSVLISALLVLSTTHLFMKVSVRPHVFLCGLLGLKYQLTN